MEIRDYMTSLSDLVNPHMIGTITSISVMTMVASIAVAPAIVARLPEDYFMHEKPHLLELLRQGPLSKCIFILAKNILGTLLLILGIILLFMPGQGLLTILAGLMMVDFPRKKHVLRRIAARPHIAHSLNWLRARRGKPPLQL